MGATETTTQTIPLDKQESGVIRVRGTRVSLDSVLYAFLDGSTPEEIVQQYPSLRLAGVYAIVGYYLENRHDLVGIRDRLLARQTKP